MVEVGFYVFTSARDGNGWSWVGDHIRPRIARARELALAGGVSLSTEVGYQRRAFSTDTWTWEIRPIIDQQLGRWYWAINPALEKVVVGESAARGWEFSPNAAVSYDLSHAGHGGARVLRRFRAASPGSIRRPSSSTSSSAPWT